MRHTRAVLAAIVLLSGCKPTEGPDPADVRQSQVPLDSPMSFHGEDIQFPLNTVDARQDSTKGWGFFRLVPDAPPERDPVFARYMIELGREETGVPAASAVETPLGDGYTLSCNPPEAEFPAFNCVALLRSLPFATILIKDPPASAAAARKLVDEAEAFLVRSKAKQK